MSLNSRSDRSNTPPKPLLNLGTVGKTIALFGISASLGIFAWRTATGSGPGPRPEYTEGSADVNKKVNNVLIPRAERVCLAKGRLDEAAFKKERRDILGDREGDVRVLCQRVKDMTDNVFTLEIGDDTRRTRDGKLYMPTRKIVSPNTDKTMSAAE